MNLPAIQSITAVGTTNSHIVYAVDEAGRVWSKLPSGKWVLVDATVDEATAEKLR